MSHLFSVRRSLFEIIYHFLERAAESNHVHQSSQSPMHHCIWRSRWSIAVRTPLTWHTPSQVGKSDYKKVAYPLVIFRDCMDTAYLVWKQTYTISTLNLTHRQHWATTGIVSVCNTAARRRQPISLFSTLVSQTTQYVMCPVSYTHLTLPTIYSV